MKLSAFLHHLHQLSNLEFELPDGAKVPRHFHITEVGSIERNFIDCGGMVRKHQKINFQLFVANDLDHRLSPKKLSAIISKSINVLQLPDEEVEVEYQRGTIGKYGISFRAGVFVLESTLTECLASDQCGIPQQKPKIRLGNLQQVTKTEKDSPACC